MIKSFDNRTLHRGLRAGSVKVWLVLIIFLFTIAGFFQNVFAQADWAKFGADNKLVYKQDTRGNRIMDFSYAGYMGGGVSLPVVPVKVTVNASSGDRTAAIQSAVNQVAAMPLVNGFRGAVLLGPGTFDISSSININASGVVVRGSGSGTGGTVVNMAPKTSSYRAFLMSGSGTPVTTNSVNISGSYVPSGTRTFTVSDASSYQVGNTILIYRTVTQAWIEFVGMDDLVRNGEPQTWIAAGTKITTDRIITAINGNTITVDAPLTDSFDATYLGTPVGTIAKYSHPTRITQTGLEHLRIKAPSGTAVYGAVTMDDVMDSWILDVVSQNTQNAFNANQSTKRITWEKVVNHNDVTQTNTAATADFSATGTQIFLNKCESTAKGIWPVIAGARGTGPIVILNFKSAGRGIEPHQRWTTGFLADNCIMPSSSSGTPGISYRNRATAGSGHGWCTGWSVAWNCETPYFLVSQAPGTYNWAIGGHGTKVSKSDPEGIFDHFNSTVIPQSLYLQQLLERLGPQALANIGYGTAPTCEPVIASGDDGNGNVAANVLDKNLATRWSASGDAWIQFCLGDVKPVSGVKIAFYLGNERKYNFDVQTSTDGANWSAAATNLVSSGTSLNLETFMFAPRQAKYVRIYGHGNNVNTWNGYTEVEIVNQDMNHPPTVSITSPANNAVFAEPASINISASASDMSDGIVAKVEFFQGSTKLGEDLTVPFSFNWTNVPPGNYSLKAVATDNGGLSTTSSPVSVTVNPNQSPGVSITSPAFGSSFIAPGPLTINAHATDPDGTISKVEFFEGANKLGEDLTAPYSFTWTNVPPGNYTLTAKATDNGGLTATSEGITITMNPNQPPAVSITSPATGASFTAPASITINATASDSDGPISKVEFYQGATKLGEDLSSPYSFAWTNVPAGNYSLTAKAIDNAANEAVSVAVDVTVEPGSGTQTLSPVHDAYVRNGIHANTAHGATDAVSLITKMAPATQVDNSRETFLKFDLASVSGSVTSVQLKVFGRIEDATVTNIPVGIFSVTNTTWTETAITWNNKPVAGTTAITSATVTDATARYYTWDITNYVKAEVAAGRKVISLTMKSGIAHNPRILWNSKETGSSPPQLTVVSASAPCDAALASADDGNVATNVLDDNLATRWSASGDPQWIQFCLSTIRSVSGVQIAFYKGNERSSKFDIQTSLDGVTFTDAVTGLISSGTSLALENFPISPRNAKFVRIVGHGNTLNLWNSYAEVKITSGAPTIKVSDEMLSTEKLSVSCYPNPSTTASVTIMYELKQAGRVKLMIYNSGTHSSTILLDDHKAAGKHETQFDTKNLPHGLHMIKLFQNGEMRVVKLLKQ